MTHTTLDKLAQHERTRREILHKSELVPPLPDLVVRLLRMLNSQETEPRDLEELLKNDQVLVAKMLAMVNSPFYGLNRTIRTVKEAVMVLGFRGVRSLVLATSTARFLQQDYSCYGHEAKGLWVHAISVATGARLLARLARMHVDMAEQMFVAGLLHDIGKLVLVPYLTQVNHADRTEPDVAAFERRAIGIDHTEAGALVAAKWNLAAEVQEVIKAHHDFGTGIAPGTLAVVRLADSVAHERGAGYLPGMAPAATTAASDLASLGFDGSSWTAVRDQIAVAMDEAVVALAKLSG